jgi:20S proteasome subunit alpha 7
MASSGSGYDLFSSTFSPDGRIFQIEYATKAVENAGTVIGIKTTNGIVLGVSKPIIHKMIVPTTCSYKRIHTIDIHTGIASTGFLPDARVVVSRAIDEASDFYTNFGIKIPPNVLAERLGYYMHYFTIHGGLRPFGTSAIIAGYDENTLSYSLYMIEPNGCSYSYYGVAAGKGKQPAKTELEKLNLHRSSTDTTTGISTTTSSSSGSGAATTVVKTTIDAVNYIAKILMLLHNENKDNAGKTLEMEFSWICPDSNNEHVAVPKDIVSSAKMWAQEQLDADNDDDDDDDDNNNDVVVAAAMEGTTTMEE